MVIVKTPFRMSFVGGGTDIPLFFNKFTGSVISTTFNRYCYVTVRHLPPFFDYRSELVYSKVERIINLDEIMHPAIREAMKLWDLNDIRLTYEGDLPARTGLGTSSAFAVGMNYAFSALEGKYISKKELAKMSIYLERERCKESGGWQDQVASTYGGLNRIEFNNNRFGVRPIIMSKKRKEKFDSNLLLFFTGFSRMSFEIQRGVENNIENNIEYLLSMNTLVDDVEKILVDEKADLDEFGKKLDECWMIKKQFSPEISNDRIDELYNKAKNKGALGGKLLGAGGGGFLLLYVPKKYQKSVKVELKELRNVPFRFEEEGSRIIYYSSEEE